MKISQNTKKLLNNQIVLEANAANSYLAMASWCEITGYVGAASFFYAQSDEERSHMLKFIRYLNNIGGNATIPAIKSPPNSFKSLESTIRAALNNEQLVTKAIYAIVETAQKEKDHSTHTFLDWFVNEQVEEEKKFETVLQKFDLIGRDKIAVHEIDKILGELATKD
ncbi:MAG: ferritin [Nitrosarchaeum sp.]|jgi:ferritin|uniref:ferritin n=1 Tax=Nitrosarchaeum sp. TaxID=2026886 RepID=UPI002DEC2220|nr:ferritin [Nitrosarchaeum sp.]